jgi:hypothetical protein
MARDCAQSAAGVFHANLMLKSSCLCIDAVASCRLGRATGVNSVGQRRCVSTGARDEVLQALRGRGARAAPKEDKEPDAQSVFCEGLKSRQSGCGTLVTRCAWMGAARFGFVMKLGFPPAPLLGYVLGADDGGEMRRPMLMPGGDPSVFVTRPAEPRLHRRDRADPRSDGAARRAGAPAGNRRLMDASPEFSLGASRV